MGSLNKILHTKQRRTSGWVGRRTRALSWLKSKSLASTHYESAAVRQQSLDRKTTIVKITRDTQNLDGEPNA